MSVCGMAMVAKSDRVSDQVSYTSGFPPHISTYTDSTLVHAVYTVWNITPYKMYAHIPGYILERKKKTSI